MTQAPQTRAHQHHGPLQNPGRVSLRALLCSALRSLDFKCEIDDYGFRKFACPIAEGRFEQLNHIEIDGFGMERKALDAVLRQVPNLTDLDLTYIEIGKEGCGHLALGLEEDHPDVQTLDLLSSSIGALPDALGQLRSTHFLPRHFPQHQHQVDPVCSLRPHSAAGRIPSPKLSPGRPGV